MPEPKTLIVDGWHLASPGTGLGAYAERLLVGLTRNSAFDVEWRAAVPASCRAMSLPAGHVLFVKAPRTGQPLVDRLLWNARLGLLARGDNAALFSPAPFWCPAAPPAVAVTHHDCIVRRFPCYQGRRYLRRWMLRREERFLSRCRLVLTESEFSKQELVELTGVDAARVRVIPAWLPPEFDAGTARADAGRVRAVYRLPGRYWLYVGGYDYRKNVDFLIRAYAQAASGVVCPPLVLAGNLPTDLSGPVCDPLGAMAGAGVDRGRQIVTPGFVPAADLPGLYAGAELFVYPSRYEGYGLPPLEAMGCGCPAIVGDNSSLREVVRDREYRFATDDQAQLAVLLARAATIALPPNPSFRAADHAEAAAMRAYGDVLSALAGATWQPLSHGGCLVGASLAKPAGAGKRRPYKPGPPL